MTIDQGNDSKGKAFLADHSSISIPSRFVLLESSIVSTLDSQQKSKMYHIHVIPGEAIDVIVFYGLRDAIHFVSGHLQAKYCSDIILDHFYIPHTKSAFVITIKEDGEEGLHKCTESIKNLIKNNSECLVSSIFVNSKDATVEKFFVEFFEQTEAENASKFFENISQIESAQIGWKGCPLALEDKRFLFDCLQVMLSDCSLSEELSVGALYNAGKYGGNSQHNHHLSSTTSSLPPFQSLNLEEEDSQFIASNHQRTISSNTSCSLSSSVQDFEIDFDLLNDGFEERSTLMIKNIPNKYTQQMLIEMINETHWGTFDFIYLRMDFKNKCNVGYAFINFTSTESIATFATRMMGRRWPCFNSDKRCHLTFARIQGRDALVDKFRHSRVMVEAQSYRPKVYYNDGGPLHGQEQPFPT